MFVSRTLYWVIGYVCFYIVNSSLSLYKCKYIQTDIVIIDVWKYNLYQEIRTISDFIERFNYISMDTEFPGVVAKPTNPTSNYRYQTMRLNINMCKIIQLGIFICDKDGNYIPDKCCWQFNFRFDEYDDLYAVESIKLLKNSGINFDELKVNGMCS